MHVILDYFEGDIARAFKITGLSNSLICDIAVLTYYRTTVYRTRINVKRTHIRRFKILLIINPFIK